MANNQTISRKRLSYWPRRLLQAYVSLYRAQLVGHSRCPVCRARVYEFGLHCPRCEHHLSGSNWRRHLDKILARYNRLNAIQRLILESFSYLEEAIQPGPSENFFDRLGRKDKERR